MKKFLHKNKYSIGICLISIIVSGLYFFYISRYVKDKAWDTSTTFVSTFFSIIIGATISIIIYNHQKDQRDNDRFEALKLNLTAELSDLKRILSLGEAITVNQLPFVVTFIQPIIIDECAKSGLFNSQEVENFLHLSRKIKFYNVQVSYLLSLLNNFNATSFNTLLSNSHKNMETSKVSILYDIQFLATKLSITLTDSINYN